MEGQWKSVWGEGGKGEHRRGSARKGWGTQVCKGEHGAAQREVLASKTTWEGGQASDDSTSHPLKSSPETHRPECKSWCESNSSWNLCSALYARMVQSPWREDAKWENTGLRAGEAETNTWQRVREAGCKETHCLPCAVFARSAKQHSGIPGWVAWGRRDDALSGENSPCATQTPAHVKLHLNDLEMKDSLWVYLCACMLSLFNCVWLFTTLWTHPPGSSVHRIL